MPCIRFSNPQQASRRRAARLMAIVGAGLVVWFASEIHAGEIRAAEPGDGVDFFERKVRPILVQRCYECHSRSAKHLQGELSLDHRAGILKGGETGPMLIPGKPDESLLVEAIRYDGDTQMPPSGKLPDQEVALVTEWVRRGAPLPDDGAAAAATKTGIDFEAGRKFWSFQTLRHFPTPAVDDSQWPQRPIDFFLLAALQRQGIKPSAEAERRVLIRRATFDLIGLPPSPEEVEHFTGDLSPDAYQRLIDRLLASPHYGERWARYWLDLARYADANELSLENRSQAWLYRDWLVQALNDDVPYDRFVRLQLAADLTPGTEPADLAALGFLGISPVYFKELKLSPPMIETIVADEWEERIDALGRTFLGLSLACARCHDHKFDPVSVDDYYALAGVLASTRLVDRYVVAKPEEARVRQAHEQVSKIEAEIEKLKASKEPKQADKDLIGELTQQIRQIKKQTPNYDCARAHGVDDAALHVLADGPNHTKLDYHPGEAIDVRVQVRGNPAKPGRVVPRRFLTVLSNGTPRPFTAGSGRRELAEALIQDAAPLTARVIVNRVWKHHFGSGLVETVSDFGAQGARPSHPELLDDLAVCFVEHGWSLKWLHREIVLSAAYRQSSDYSPNRFSKDPENRWLGRMNRRRLDIEAWRDAILKVCGTLDERLGGQPLPFNQENHRRTIYGRISRSEPDSMLRLFDFPDPSSHSPDRTPTTTPLQQLFVLNGPLLAGQSTALVQRLESADLTSVEAEVRWFYQQIFSRLPSSSELRLGAEFLSEGKAGERASNITRQQYAQALLGSNEFLFVD